VRDSTALHAINGRSVHLGWETVEVESANRFLVDNILANSNALADLAVEVWALGEQLPVKSAHCLAATHHDIAKTVFDHCVWCVAIEKAFEVACVVRIKLGRDNIGSNSVPGWPPAVWFRR
jgi:hypothetical protein